MSRPTEGKCETLFQEGYDGLQPLMQHYAQDDYNKVPLVLLLMMMA